MSKAGRPLRIALVSYHFYNESAAGLSTAKVARALAARGHRISLFTTRQNWLPETPAAQQDSPFAALDLYRIDADPSLVPSWWRALAARAPRHALWDKLAAVPTLLHGCTAEQWGWVAAVCRRFAEVAAPDRPFDLLLTRLNHFLSHIVGLRLAAHYPHLPWCAYFSDPWPFHLYPSPYNFRVGPVARRRLEVLLARILTHAGAYVFPSEQLRDHLLCGARARFRDKAFVAPHLASLNGDALHCASCNPGPRAAEERDVLRIRHAGFLMTERNVDGLFAALRALQREQPTIAASLRIELAGRYVGGHRPAAPPDLEGMVRFQGYASPEDTWRWMCGADALLLVEAKMEEGIFFPSKLAEYLGTGRPILALSPRRGVAADRLGDNALRVEPDDVASIRAAFETLHQHWQAGRLAALAPSAAQLHAIAPATVMPIYEEAFAHAMAGNRQPTRQEGASP